MESVNYENGINGVKRLLLGDTDYRYDRVYYSSNENLNPLLSSVNMEDKDVLTVQASSDQLFYVSNQKPFSIDTFDINYLTKYYFYLRKWFILYANEYYFDIYNSKKIYELLSKVKTNGKEEQDAYNFWLTYVKTIPCFFTKDVFYMSVNPFKNKIADLKELKEFLIDYKLRFNRMDISKEIVRKKYDTIIISNILEYYDEDIGRINDIRDNLCNMLNDNGQVVASHLMNRGLTYTIYSSFHKLFDVKEVCDKKDSLGCVYTKKDVNKK